MRKENITISRETKELIAKLYNDCMALRRNQTSVLDAGKNGE